MRRSCLLVLLAALSSCRGVAEPASARSADPIAAPPSARPIASGSDTPAASAAPSATASASQEAPIPPLPPGANPELFAIAASICAVAVTAPGAGNVLVGCRSHPPFARPEQKPDGTVAQPIHAPSTYCFIEKLIKGSFTRAGAQQTIVAFGTCEQPGGGGWNGGAPGSALLLEQTGGRWTEVAYEPGVTLAACDSVPFEECYRGCAVQRRADGRDMLFCKSTFDTGGASIRGLFTLDFSKPDEHRTQNLFEWGFNPGLDWSCQQGPIPDEGFPLFFKNGVTSLVFRGLSFEDADRDGKPDLNVHARYAYASSTVVAQKAKARCARGAATVTPTDVLPRARDLTLVWRSDGDELVPMPDTQKQIDKWKAPTHGP